MVRNILRSFFFLQVFHGALNYFVELGGTLFCLESFCYVFSYVQRRFVALEVSHLLEMSRRFVEF